MSDPSVAATMWEPALPSDGALRQGDLIDLRAASIAFPNYAASLPVVTPYRNNEPVLLVPAKWGRGLVVSHCCTNDQPLQGQHRVTIAPVGGLALAPNNRKRQHVVDG